MNRLRCDACNVDVHKAYYVRHLRSKKHLENLRQNIPECFRETIEIKIYILLQIARDNN